jgi:hypothetical protein
MGPWRADPGWESPLGKLGFELRTLHSAKSGQGGAVSGEVVAHPANQGFDGRPALADCDVNSVTEDAGLRNQD